MFDNRPCSGDERSVDDHFWEDMDSDDDDDGHYMGHLFAHIYGGRPKDHLFQQNYEDLAQMFHWDKEDRDYSLFGMIDDDSGDNDDDDDDDVDHGFNFGRAAAAAFKAKPQHMPQTKAPKKAEGSKASTTKIDDGKSE